MNVVETSIIGRDFGHFICDPFEYNKGFPYVYLNVEGEDKPLLVKVLRFRRLKKNENLQKAEFIRNAHNKEVLNLMLNMVRGIIWENKINAKVIDGEFDGEKGILRVRYASEKPLDLKDTVLFLAKRLHVRVEFEHSSYARFASEIGWLERCGLELCCKVFLKNIPSVSQDMARRQYLFAAPDKLTGVCGRLLCCLTYELPFYEEMSSKVPKLNSTVKTAKGEGKVVEVNLIAGYYVVLHPDGSKEKVKIE